MSASLIYDLAPIGCIVAWSDGSPRPSERFKKKLAAWQTRNSSGRLIRKEGPRQSGNYVSPGYFTLHEADFGGKNTVVMRIHRTFGLDSNLTFKLFKADRDPAPLRQALCWAHSRRKFFVLADIAANAKRGSKAAPISPMALEAVKRIDALFDIEREINGLSSEQRLERRRQDSQPLIEELHNWLQTERVKLSRSSPVSEPIDYMLKRWDGFTSFLDDGRICLTNNAAERALRGFALGRKSWLFAGSDRGADRAAFMATLIMTAKLNDIDPQAWLADVLANIADTPISRLEQLLPWNWTPKTLSAQAA